MNPEHTALLVIDPRPGEASHLDGAQLAQALDWIASVARQQRRVVVRVGDEGSAFRDADLHARLAHAGVRCVLLAGHGVLPTARDARALGYDVEVLADATTAPTRGKHAAAMRDVAALGARTRLWRTMLSEGDEPVSIAGLGSGDTTLWCNALRGCVDDATYAALEREVDWNTMLHRGGEVPRLVAVQGTRGAEGVEPLYRHPVDGQPALRDWTPVVDTIRRAVEARVGHPLNHCLLQLYRHGRDWISEHSDKTLDVVRPSSIINVSLGRARTMQLRPKRAEGEGEAGVVQKVPLPHASVLVMGLGTNRTHYHAIRQEGASDEDGPRISLTFRCIGTHLHPATGAVWGVGARAATREEGEARASARAAMSDDERGRVEREESEAMLRLFRAENIDSGFDAAAYRPGFDVVDLRALNQEVGGPAS